MALKIAINGFGRIGRSLTRVICDRDDVEIVAINDLASLEMMANLLKNDSVHGKFKHNIEKIDNHLIIKNKKIRLFCEADPENLNFAQLGADVVIECRGLSLTQDSTRTPIEKGFKK